MEIGSRFENLESEQVVSNLEKLARKNGIRTEIPREGTVAYERLEEACKDYIASVYEEIDGKANRTSQGKRRSYHNQLCVMLFGQTWHDVDEKNRGKVSNFAAAVVGAPDLIGTF